MTATHGEGAYGNAVGVTTPTDHKMAQVAEFVKTAANTIRPGLLWDGNATVVSGKANMSYDVRAFSIVTTRGATSGAMKWANDATVNVVTTAAPGSNSRYDVVYAWHREYAIDGTNSDPVIGVIQGTAAASPTVPALTSFPGAVQLATILVPAGVTATNSGTTITQTAPFTAAAGGVVAVRSTTERDAGSWLEGQLVELLDSHALQQYSGTGWNGLAGGLVPVTPSSVAGTGVSLSGNKVTFTAASSISVNGCFTSTFDNYLIILDNTSKSSVVDSVIQLRLAGTNAAGANYNYARGFDSGTTRTVASSATGTSMLCDVGGGLGDSFIKVYAPALAQTTRISAEAVSAGLVATIGGAHNVSTAYDGFTISPTSGNATGSLRIYGFAN
jgi:hypothetical protein